MRSLPFFALTALGLLVATPALASESTDDTPDHRVSITFSPIHLLFPIVEVTGEFAVTDKIGVAGIVGYGSVPVQSTSTTERFRAFELGGHLNYYVVGTFDHGMQLGVEALYVDVASSGTTFRSAAAANGFAIGPYAGYKIITGVGFTFEGNLGFQYIAARGEATSGGTTASLEDRRVIPLLNLNVGWSF
jgi:hypothetical protein